MRKRLLNSWIAAALMLVVIGIGGPAIYANPAPSVVLQGTVTDRATGQPLAGAKVYLHSSTNTSVAATTDASGMYTLDSSRISNTSGPITFQVTGHYAISTSYTITTVPTTLDVSLLASTTPIVQGTIRDSGTGLPVAGAVVYFDCNSQMVDGCNINTVTDVNGAYAFDASKFFESATAGFQSRLHASKSGYFQSVSSFATYAPPFPITQDLTLLSSTGTVLQGTVTDRATGQPLAGAKIYLHSSTNTGVATTTDANGMYTLDGSRFSSTSGPITFQVTGHYAISTSYTITTVPTTLDVSLLASTTPIVQGTIRDSGTGLPVAGAVVYFDCNSQMVDGCNINTVTDGNGAYAFDASKFFESASAGFQSRLHVSATAYFAYSAAFATYAPPFAVTQDASLQWNGTTRDVTIATNPSNFPIVVDGTNYTSPAALTWIPGSPHTIAAPDVVAGSPGTQFRFTAWSDGGGTASRAITAPSTNATYTGAYTTQYLLTTATAPQNGGSITAGGWFDAGTTVPIAATAAAGFQFTGFTGDLRGLTNPQNLRLDAPQSVTATFSALVAPTITSAASAAFTVAAPGSFTVTATGSPTPSLSESGTVPSGVTFDPVSGILSGTPAHGTAGTYNITFTASNGVNPDAVQPFTLTVVNNPPVANAQSASTPEDTSKAITLTASDPNGDTLTFSIVSGPSHGRLAGSPPGVTYIPFLNFTGFDSFTFIANDGSLDSNAATVSITVSPANDPPIAHSQALYVLEDKAKTITLAGSDAESSPLDFAVDTNPAHGVLSGTPPNLTYTPAPDYNGVDTFTFHANDGSSDSNVATVQLTVVPSLWVSNGPDTGYVGQLVADPTVPSLIYVVAAGNIWKSTDAGNNWQRLIVGSDTYSFAPVPGSPLVLYAGISTGLLKSTDGGMSWSSVSTRFFSALAIDPQLPTRLYGSSQGSLLKSVDDGATWTSAGSGLTNVYRVIIDQAVSTTLYAIANGSVFKSTDSAATWTAANAGLPANVFSLSIDPTNSSILYTAAPGSGAFKSVDAGSTWSGINNGLMPYPYEIGIDRQNTATLYAATLGGVYKSLNAGASWTYRSTGVLGQLSSIGVDLGSPDTVYVGGDHGVFKTTNAAGSWTSSNAGLSAGYAYAVAAHPTTLGALYGGAYYGGVFKTVDAGGTWAVTGLNYFGTQEIVIDPVTPTTVYAAGTCAGVYKSIDDGAHWSSSSTGMTDSCVSALALDPSGPSTLYAGTRGGVFKSTDSASSWTVRNTGLATLDVAAIAVDGTNGGTVYAGTRAGLFKSVDGGGTWTAASSGLPANANVNAVVIDPTDPQTIYAGAGSLYKSTNGGATWSMSSSGLTGASVQSLVFDAAVPSTIYAGTTKGVFISRNSGAAWTPLVTRGMARTDVWSVAVSGGKLYAATNGGSVASFEQAANDPPTATDQVLVTAEETPKSVVLVGSDPDGDTLTFAIVTPPSHGTLTASGPNVTYIPATNYYGPDSFRFTVNDGFAGSNIATVSITVTPVNDAPIANDDTYTTSEDATLTIVAGNGVLGNDSDPDGDGLQALVVSAPTHGTLTLNADGSFSYTPAANYNGPDSFSYRASDGAATSGIATVSIGIGPVNDAPVAANDSYGTNEDAMLTVPAPGVLGNDTDVDGNALESVLVSGPAHGTLTLNADGSFSYTPAPNYNGPDSFSYKATDGSVDSNVAAISIAVAPVNDVPAAADDSYSTNLNTALTVAASGVLTNDADLDGDALTAVQPSVPAHGTLALNADGSFIYTPAGGYSGPDAFTYRASDGAATSNVATVSITVTAPAVTLAPGSLAFGNQLVGTSSAGQTVTLTNTGNGLLTIAGISLGGADAGDFGRGGTCGASLAPAATCAIVVTFAPTATGSRSATLQLSSNAVGSPNSALSGTGTAPVVNLAPASLTFGNQTVGTTSVGQTVTVTNTGTGALNITSVAVTGTNATDFTQTNSCGTSVAPGGSCSITVRFAPTNTGTRTAAVAITDNAAGSPQTVSLTGTGRGGQVTLTPTSLVFATQVQGTMSSAQQITVKNTGTTTVTVTGIVASGDFQVATTTCGATLAGGVSCFVNITFTPTAPGARSGTLNVSGSAGTQTAALSGTGTVVSLSPVSVTFGNQNVGTTSSIRVVTLTNVSASTTVNVLGVSLTGAASADFAQTTACGSVAPGASCAIQVTFTPTRRGARNGTLVVSHDDGGSPAMVTLSGFGR